MAYFVPLTEIEAKQKNTVSAALLAFFLGALGAHRFYLGRKGSGYTILAINLLSFGLALFITIPLCIIEAIYYASLAPKPERSPQPITNSLSLKSQLSEANQQFKSEMHTNSQKFKADMHANNAQFRQNISDIFVRPKPPAPAQTKAADIDIIDVSASAPSPIPTPSHQSANWLRLLQIPYERRAMEIPQIREGTLKLYEALCNFVDKELGQRKPVAKSLLKLKYELDRSGGHYSNILYTIYCIAEGEVEHHYSGKGYDNTFSYKLLESHADNQLAESVKRFCGSYVDSLPSANSETQTAYSLTTSGMPRLWWDSSGDMRKELELTTEQIKLFENTFHRSTTLMNIPEIKVIVGRQYLATMMILRNRLGQTSDWRPTMIGYIEYAFGLRPYYDFNDYTAWRIGSGLLKLCEQTVRENLPYSRLLKTEEEVAAIREALPEAVSNEVLSCATRLIAPIHLSAETTELLRKQNPSAWRRVIKELNKASPERCAFTLMRYKDDPDFSLITKHAVKCTEGQPINCLLACYLHYSMRVDNQHEAEKPVEKAMLSIITHPYQQKEFMKLVRGNHSVDAELIKSLDALTRPPVRSVKLDDQKIKAAQTAHEEAVKRVTGYLGEDDEPEEADNSQVAKSPTITLDNLFGDSDSSAADIPTLDHDQVEFLRMLVDANYELDIKKAEDFARSKHKLPSSFVQAINRQCYEMLEDQLISTVDDKITIEVDYREQAKEILNS